MPQKELKKYLLDILQTIEGIDQIEANFVVKDLDILTNKWALERGISIIGEALYKANNLDRTLAITNKPKIIATRHIVVHDYDIVNSETLIVIVKKHLPILKEEVENILKNLA